MSGKYPALGFDPAPGSVGTITTLADNLGTVAKELSEAYHELSTVGRSDGFWRGEAAEAFHGKIGPLPDYLDKANRSLGDAAKVLHEWSSDLTSLQHKAVDFEAQAAKAIGEVDRANANPDLGLAGRQFPDADSLRAAQSRLDAAQAQVTKADEELEAIREQAKRLMAQHFDLADQVAAALRRAKDEAPDEPGFFEWIAEGLGEVFQGVKDLAAKAWQFVQDHADLIAKIGDVLSAVGTVLSVATVACAAIPIVGEVVASAAIGVNGAALAAHGLAKAAGANVSWSTLAFDAVGLIPGGGAAKGLGALKATTRLANAFGRGAKFAKGAEGLEAAAKGAEAAGKVLPRMAKANFEGMVNVYNKIVPKAAEVAVDSVGGAVAGIAVGTVKNVGITVAKWEAQPYVDNAKHAGKEFVDKLTHGQKLPSPGHVFNEVVHGRSA
jgi:hypothetical protein